MTGAPRSPRAVAGASDAEQAGAFYRALRAQGVPVSAATEMAATYADAMLAHGPRAPLPAAPNGSAARRFLFPRRSR